MNGSLRQDTPHRHALASTHWTTIRACAGNDAVASQAREEICRDYWYPVYAYIKRSGQHDNDVEDLTQGFFQDILRRPWFTRVDETRGKFRSFLLTSINNFLRDRHAHGNRLKRDGGYQHESLDLGDAGLRYAQTEVSDLAPADAYESEWAATLVATALSRLGSEHLESGKQAQYYHLKKYLTADGDESSYGLTAEALGTSVKNVRVWVHRLRRRYGVILKDEVARTVSAHEEVHEEMRHLRAVLAGVP